MITSWAIDCSQSGSQSAGEYCVKNLDDPNPGTLVVDEIWSLRQAIEHANARTTSEQATIGFDPNLFSNENQQRADD